MIIGEGVPLRRLPAYLDRKTMFFLEGIRYSVEMADLAHQRLRLNLFNVGENHAASGNGDHFAFVAAVQDAWSIVDSLHRLRGLLRQTPGVKQKAHKLQVFMRQTKNVGVLRNKVQHLNHEIDNLIDSGFPVWGTLSWFATTDAEVKTGSVCCLAAGTLFKGKEMPFVNPVGYAIHPPVDLITLTAHGHTLDLSESMRAVERLIEDMQTQFASQFAGHPTAGGDLLVRLALQAAEAEQDEESDS